jgi:hypothetical protein
MIKEGGGSQLDPEAVDAFFAVQDEILAVKKQSSEDVRPANQLPVLKGLLRQYSFRPNPNREF